MSHTLRVRWSNHAHPWLQDMGVSVTPANSATELARAPHTADVDGARTFEVPVGMPEVDVTFTITVALPTRPARGDRAPASPPTHPPAPIVWRLRGRYRVDEGALHPVAAQWPALPAGSIAGGLHARAQERCVGGAFTIDVDLAFLDATEVVRRAWPGWPEALHGCAMRAYQLLDTPPGGGATVVGVVVPQALRDDAARDAVDALMFFCPNTGHSYTDARRLNVTQFVRYVSDPPSPTFWGFYRHERAPDGTPIPLIACPFPNCRFAAQLHASRRKALLVMPFGSAADHSPWTGAQLTRRRAGERAEPLLDALLRALQDDGHLGARLPVGHAVRPGGLGVAGFSLGGESAIECFQQNRARVTDLFLFDPHGFDERPQEMEAVRAWASRPGHRLRIIGGAYLPALRAFAQSVAPAGFAPTCRLPSHLDGDASVLLLPTDTAFWHRSADYADVLRTLQDPILTAPGQRPEGSLSAPAQLFAAPALDAREHQSLVATLPDGTPASCSLEHVAIVETAAFLVQEYVEGNILPEGRATSQASLDGVARVVQLRTRNPTAHVQWPRSMRHQWTVFGGQSAGDRHDLATFKGYLQVCLETSSFAR